MHCAVPDNGVQTPEWVHFAAMIAAPGGFFKKKF
jgi:hypothetical protein